MAAARRLVAARRPLVTGLENLPAEAVLAACTLAEELGAAIDAGDADVGRPSGPTIARVGEVTADPAELRDRADLVIFWFCDPAVGDRGFIERFVAPGHPRRRTLAIGPDPVLASGSTHTHLPLERSAAVDAARFTRTLVLHGAAIGEHGPVAAAAKVVADAIDPATCVAFVTNHAPDSFGLEPWGLVHLVRSIAHRKPAFEVPLAGVATRTAAAILTWRYGAAGAIDRADRNGGRFLPGEASAVSLIRRREVDAVLVVGCAAAPVENALAAVGDDVHVIRVGEAGLPDLVRSVRSLRSEVRSDTASRERGP